MTEVLSSAGPSATLPTASLLSPPRAPHATASLGSGPRAVAVSCWAPAQVKVQVTRSSIRHVFLQWLRWDGSRVGVSSGAATLSSSYSSRGWTCGWFQKTRVRRCLRACQPETTVLAVAHRPGPSELLLVACLLASGRCLKGLRQIIKTERGVSMMGWGAD